MKKVKFITLGCKVNQYETQEMREQLAACGYSEVAGREKADLYVINTCTVTHRADADSLYAVGRARRENPRGRLIVTGCLAGKDASRIALKDPLAQIIPNSGKSGLASLIMGCDVTSVRGISYFQGRTRAFLKIQDGCDNFCSYCKVPLVRGRSVSKPEEQVLEEARRLAAGGARELVLTGICLGDYGKDLVPATSLAQVLRRVSRIRGIARIRLSSIEMRDVTDELLGVMAHSRRICPHLHIPLQSGDDGILAAMNRKYTITDYEALLERVRKGLPHVAVTTDVLVGFPGETEVQFTHTLDLLRRAGFARVHVFPYSSRPGTAAAKRTRDLVPEEVIRHRMSRCRTVAAIGEARFRESLLGSSQEVLVERAVPGKPGVWEGYTGNYVRVEIRAKRDLSNAVIICKMNQLDTPNQEKTIDGRPEKL